MNNHIKIDGLEYSLPQDAQARAIFINHLDLTAKGMKEYVTCHTLHEGRKIQISSRHLQAVGGYTLHFDKQKKKGVKQFVRTIWKALF